MIKLKQENINKINVNNKKESRFRGLQAKYENRRRDLEKNDIKDEKIQ